MAIFLTVIIIVAAIGLISTSLSVRQVQQYQRGVVLRLGRLLPDVRQPGLALMVPIIDRMTKVSIQTVVLNVPSQGAITRDNVTVGVDAVVYFRVVDPVKAVINVENYLVATSQVVADIAALGHRPRRPRHGALRPRPHQQRTQGRHRRAHRGVGHPHRPRRGEGHLAARGHAPLDVAPGRGRA